ncbi:MAG: 23S rRNA (adenine(2503)-C(2))-methyltransferase RlmN [Candidatus Korobacteraceae bacterium]
MSATAKSELLGLSLQELTEIAEAQGQPRYRGAQLFQAIYRQRTAKVTEILTLPRPFREQLAQDFEVGLPPIDRRFVSADGTIRYLVRFADGQTVETVWMPEGDGGEQGSSETTAVRRQGSIQQGSVKTQGSIKTEDTPKATICVSSQAGCAVNCRFCLTAQLGLLRNLAAGEIVGQVLTVLSDHAVDVARDRINLVFMGQGEPFLNYENFMKAVRLLVEGSGLAESRMTVSTSGILPRFADFAREPIRPKLAISLNGTNDAARTAVMPINKKWNIASLMEAARNFPLRPRERLTFEYVLLSGENDSRQNAQELARLLAGLRAKVNLIALNPGPDIPFSTPAEERVLAFQEVLVRAGIPAFIRRPRGRDIYAACGQLKRTAELAERS